LTYALSKYFWPYTTFCTLASIWNTNLLLLFEAGSGRRTWTSRTGRVPWRPSRGRAYWASWRAASSGSPSRSPWQPPWVSLTSPSAPARESRCLATMTSIKVNVAFDNKSFYATKTQFVLMCPFITICSV